MSICFSFVFHQPFIGYPLHFLHVQHSLECYSQFCLKVNPAQSLNCSIIYTDRLVHILIGLFLGFTHFVMHLLLATFITVIRLRCLCHRSLDRKLFQLLTQGRKLLLNSLVFDVVQWMFFAGFVIIWFFLELWLLDSCTHYF